jgi:predicted acetyltransferase
MNVSDRVVVRPLRPGEEEQLLDLLDVAFHQTPDSARRARQRSMIDRQQEGIGVFDGARLVGHAGVIPLRLHVPGGMVPCAGVTFVCVAPTHRRGGLLRQMMHQLQRRAAAAAQPLTALWASEGGIYGRFGFGVAAHAVDVSVDARRPLALRVPPDPRSPRLRTPEEALPELRLWHGERAHRRAGAIERDAGWWREVTFAFAPRGDARPTEPRVVLLGEPGAVGGYAIYRTSWSGERARVHVTELETDGPGSAAALWRYLTTIDLADSVHCPTQPVDVPVSLLADDPSVVRMGTRVATLWLRLHDLPRAFAEREWRSDVNVVLEVFDDCARRTRRLRLEADPAGAHCEATDREPDLRLSVRDLAASYLGAVPLAHLAETGLVEERSAGTIDRLGEALRVDLPPFAGIADEF